MSHCVHHKMFSSGRPRQRLDFNDCNSSSPLNVSENMKMRFWYLFIAVAGLLALPTGGPAQTGHERNLPLGFQRMDFNVDGVAREALVYIPPMAKTTATPIVFVFHGTAATRDRPPAALP